MTHARAALCSAIAAALIAAGSAHAGWPNDPGVNFRFAPSASSQSYMINTEDGEGGAFIVWVENNNLHAQHVTAQGMVAPGWPSGGIVICNASGGQYPTGLVPDGAGGFLVCWDDYRAGNADAYVQRVSAAGAAYWTANGVAACAATENQYNTRVCSDRAGGAIVTWNDERDFFASSLDVYAQRIDDAGAPLWTANGVAVCTAAQSQQAPAILADGTVGGSYVCWRDQRSGFDEIYAMRLGAGGVARPGWSANGNPVMSGLSTISGYPSLASDGSFGAYACWSDWRGVGAKVRLARLTPQGSLAAGWPANGLQVSSGANEQFSPDIVADGSGGAVLAWEDYDYTGYNLWAQRVSGAGAVQWGAAGVFLSLAGGDQYYVDLVSDGAGGAVAGWLDTRAGSPAMLYALRVLADGSIAPGFEADGNAVATAHWVQGRSVCTDGAGGAILTWQHNDSPQQGYAQKIDRWGQLGAQPRIASVKDVPNDQGGAVKLSWDRSPLDAWPSNGVSNYSIYRSVPPQAALAALERGEAVLAAGGADRQDATAARGAARRAVAAAGAAPGKRAFVTTALAGATVYWELVGNVYATQLAGYSVLAPTAQDSVPGSAPRTLFMVRAEDWGGARHWDSDPDSAYSTDDLAPAPPEPFTGTYSGGTTYLHWLPNSEPDLAHYRLYRGTSAGFVPGPGNLVASPPDTGHADAGAAGYYYKLTAVDSHGNESGATLLSPSGTLAVEGGAPAALALAPATPNPSRGATTCRFALPSAGAVKLELYDAAGRLVRVLADGEFAPGEHAVRWDGTGEGGARVPSGLYLARLTFGGRTLTGKVARIE